MKHALALARLELREWRALPIVVLAVGCLPVLFWIAGSRGIGFLLAYHWLVHGAWNLTALLAGAMIFTREQREHRSEFLLARPLSAGAVWCGKLLAALAVTVATTALCLLPGWPLPVLDERIVTPAPVGPLDAALAYAAGTLLLVSLGHWGALACAGGRWRRVADAGVVGTLLFLGAREWERLGEAGFLPPPRLAHPAQLALASAPLLAAGLFQVWRARADAGRAYAVYSTANWVAMALVVAALACCRC